MDVNIEISKCRFNTWVWRKPTNILIACVSHKLKNTDVSFILHQIVTLVGKCFT